jgi:hypothetical protein
MAINPAGPVKASPVAHAFAPVDHVFDAVGATIVCLAVQNALAPIDPVFNPVQSLTVGKVGSRSRKRKSHTESCRRKDHRLHRESLLFPFDMSSTTARRFSVATSDGVQSPDTSLVPAPPSASKNIFTVSIF